MVQKKNEAKILKEKFSDFIEVIQNKKNLGFTGGNNVAIKKILAENNSQYILLLNNDTKVDKKFLNILIKKAEKNQNIGILGPKIYNYNNTIQSVGGKINFYTGKVKHVDQNQLNIDYVSGCALLIKTKVIKKIGLLKEKYFTYWEETDWCQRAQKAGYSIKIAPQAVIWHKEYASTKKHGDFADYQITRNKLWFLKTHASWFQFFIFNIYFWLFTVPVRIIKNQNLKIFFKAIKDGYKKI